MRTTCPSCGGSGRYVHASGRYESCFQCGGMGSVFAPTNRVGDPQSPPSGDGSGCLILLAFIAGLLVVAMVIVGYAASSELFWRYWADADIRTTNWTQLGIFVLGTSIAVAIIARFWGSIIASMVGLIPALPMMMATRGKVNIWYIVTGDEFINNSFTAFVAMIGIVAINCWIATAVQKLPNAPGMGPNFSWLKSPAGLVSSAIMVICVIVFLVMVRRAVLAW